MNEHLLLNLLLSMTPVFAYQFILFRGFLERDSLHVRMVMGIISGLASVLCMVFPIVSGAGFLWDLRWVPLMIAVLYGGLSAGLISTALLFLYRVYIGGWLACALVLFDALAILAVTLYCRPHLRRSDRTQAMALHFVLSAGVYVIALATIFVYFVVIGQPRRFDHGGLRFFVSYGVITVAAYIFSVMLIENIIEHGKLREEVQQADKLHVMGEMAAAFAHEIRNPLTVVKGFVQLWAESLNASTVHLDLVVSELDRAEGIIRDYLNFAQPQPDLPEVVSVQAVCAEVTEIATPFAILNGVTIRECANSQPNVFCDVHKLKQSLMNVIKNSIEALPQGGHVSVRVGEAEDMAIIEIQDDGAGMSESELKQLGKPFYTTKSKGTGLGLMVTFRLMEVMGGAIHFESSPGRGTTVVLKLPVHRQNASLHSQSLTRVDAGTQAVYAEANSKRR